MSNINILSKCRSVWEEVATKVNKAVVFMDDVSAENLHWNGGAMLLIQAGATNIKEFSSFEVLLTTLFKKKPVSHVQLNQGIKPIHCVSVLKFKNIFNIHVHTSAPIMAICYPLKISVSLLLV